MKKIFYLILIVLTGSFSSCKKNDIGGDATVVCHIIHHNTPIYGATVYVKFDAQDLPSDIKSNYDLKIQGATTENTVSIDGLRYGKYYLYAEGYDTQIMDDVRGGVPLKIKWGERKSIIDIQIPVTE